MRVTLKTRNVPYLAKPRRHATGMLKNCYESGRRAKLAGIKLDQCPHAAGSPARDAWEQGWRQK